jgi:hypothetical protein
MRRWRDLLQSWSPKQPCTLGKGRPIIGSKQFTQSEDRKISCTLVMRKQK